LNNAITKQLSLASRRLHEMQGIAAPAPMGFACSVALALVVAACAAGPRPGSARSADELRDLTATEKKIIADTVAAGLKDRGSAQFRWARFPRTPGEEEYYCATVATKGAAGTQPYMVRIFLADGRISTAMVIGIAASGGGRAAVEKMCTDQSLDPYSAS
jgi:hypothetical protein